MPPIIDPRLEPLCPFCTVPVPLASECQHGNEKLDQDIEDAFFRWQSQQAILKFIVSHARARVQRHFSRARERRHRATLAYLQTLPFWTLYQTYRGAPPLSPEQMAAMRARIADVQQRYRDGVDDDWHRACLRYPALLDHYLSLVAVDLPKSADWAASSPVPEPRRLDARGGGGKEGRRRRRGASMGPRQGLPPSLPPAPPLPPPPPPPFVGPPRW